jgi:hypothetical protein
MYTKCDLPQTVTRQVGQDGVYTTAERIFRELALLLPPLLCFPVLRAIIRIGSVLESISVLDPDLLGRVVEDMDESVKLSEEFSEKLRSKLDRAGLTEESLEQLCRTLGDSGSGTLRADGLRELLLIIGFHISDSKFARLFRVLGECTVSTAM